MEKETLYKFFDGKASREEKEAVRIWLESSPENEQMLFREREFFDAMILSGSTKSAGTEKKSRPFYRTVLFEAMKIAAVFAITIACGTYFYKSEIRKIGEAMNTITVPAGQRANLTLPDGTNVWLNARSEMRYPAAFTGNKREISLDGEAYFEVTHKGGKPFVVRTDKCNVEVLGTKVRYGCRIRRSRRRAWSWHLINRFLGSTDICSRSRLRILILFAGKRD